MSIRTGKNVRIIPCDQIHTRKAVDKPVDNRLAFLRGFVKSYFILVISSQKVGGSSFICAFTSL
jgi:hypothetical protein